MKVLKTLLLLLFAIGLNAQHCGNLIFYPLDSAYKAKWKNVPTWNNDDVTVQVPDSGSYYIQGSQMPLVIVGFNNPARNNGTLHFRKNKLGIDQLGGNDADGLIEPGESFRICVDKYNTGLPDPDYYFEQVVVWSNHDTYLNLGVWDQGGVQSSVKNYFIKKGRNVLDVFECGQCVDLKPASCAPPFSIKRVRVYFDPSCASGQARFAGWDDPSTTVTAPRFVEETGPTPTDPINVTIYNVQGDEVYRGKLENFTQEGFYVVHYPDGERVKIFNQ